MNDKFKLALAEGRNVHISALARAVGVTRNSLYSAIARGEVKAIRIGKAIRVPAAEARRLLCLDDAEAA